MRKHFNCWVDNYNAIFREVTCRIKGAVCLMAHTSKCTYWGKEVNITLQYNRLTMLYQLMNIHPCHYFCTMCFSEYILIVHNDFALHSHLSQFEIFSVSIDFHFFNKSQNIAYVLSSGKEITVKKQRHFSNRQVLSLLFLLSLLK